MSTLASASPPLSARPRGAAAPWAIELLDLAGAEPVWRALERGGPPLPYSRFDWVAAFARTLPEGAVRVALARDEAGRPAALLPLATSGVPGFRLASAVGGKHANLVGPVLRPGLAAALDPEGAGALLRLMARAAGADLLVLPHVPVLLDGSPNPFAASGRPSPSPAYRLELGPDGEATLGRSMSRDARKKMRSKERALAATGPVRLLEAADAATVDRLLSAFFRQKEERFGALGIADPFAAAAMRACLRDASLRGLDDGAPAVELYGLLRGEDVLAVIGGAATSERWSGMFLSFDAEAGRFSPGDLLVARVVGRQCERGRRVFDLGVGDARYKRSVCDGEEALVDTVLPVGFRGRVAAGLLGLGLAAKRRFKASPRAMAALAAGRRSLASLRGRA